MGDYRKSPHWTRDSSGDWAVCVPGEPVDSGAKIIVSKADGTFEDVFIGVYLEEGKNGHLYTVDTSASDREYRARTTNLRKLDKKKKTAEFIGSEGEL